jgi:hypothetical protein
MRRYYDYNGHLEPFLPSFQTLRRKRAENGIEFWHKPQFATISEHSTLATIKMTKLRISLCALPDQRVEAVFHLALHF